MPSPGKPVMVDVEAPISSPCLTLVLALMMTASGAPITHCPCNVYGACTRNTWLCCKGFGQLKRSAPLFSSSTISLPSLLLQSLRCPLRVHPTLVHAASWFLLSMLAQPTAVLRIGMLRLRNLLRPFSCTGELI